MTQSVVRSSWILGSLCGLIAAGSIVAQEAPPHKQHRFEMFTGRRARLGISVNVRARETDSVGAYVNGVTPGGPAARAGIKSGDIITRLNAQSLVQSASDAGKRESAPGLRLIELAAKLEPNDTVSLEYRRGKDTRTVQLVTADEPNVVFEAPDGEDGFAYAFGDEGPFRRRFEMQGDLDPERMAQVRSRMERIKIHGPESGPFVFAFGTTLADLELAPINADLGRYFGVTQGVLVISLPDDSKLNLKAGDVVLSVGGRAPTSPSHLLRILRSYEDGEEFKIEVMRMKKKETVTGKLSQPDPDPEGHH